MNWTWNPQTEPDFDCFLAAVKLLADAAVTGVDFDDFALHFEKAEGNPLYDERETTFVFNVTDALQNGLDKIMVQMQIGREIGGSVEACLDPTWGKPIPVEDENEEGEA